MDLSTLSDDELLGKVEALAETERFMLADFLIHLAELDCRDACENRGYASVFAYLTRRLGYSESDAIRRVRAARAAQRFPSILRMLAKGELHLVGVAMLEPVLTSENYSRLLRRASRRSQREIEKMVVELGPAAPEPRDRIRALPAPAKPAPPAVSLEQQPSAEALPGLEPSPLTESVLPEDAQQRRMAFTFTASEQVRQWFLEARDLLRHRFPQGRMEDVIGEALRLLVERKRPGKTHRKAVRRGVDRSRRVPEWVKAEAWRRDEGRCSYVGPGGVRCGETAWLEFDHTVPWSLGGRSDDPDNIRLLCRAHNQSEARRLLAVGARSS